MTHDLSSVRLGSPDRGALEAHFLALDRDDRRLRFGANIGDDGLRDYVARIDFEHDGVFAVQDETLRILAVVHVARSPGFAELGLSVLPAARGQGLGGTLFRRALVFLRNLGIESVFVHCLSENAAMMHMARGNGMRVESSGSETDARLALPPATVDSYVSEWLDDQRGRAVQALRRNARLARALFNPFPAQA